MSNRFHRVRLSDAEIETLRTVAKGIVSESERHQNQRRDTSFAAPLIRLLAEGKLAPVRLPEDSDYLALMLRVYVDEEGNLADPQQAGSLLTELIAKIARQELRLIHGGL